LVRQRASLAAGLIAIVGARIRRLFTAMGLAQVLAQTPGMSTSELMKGPHGYVASTRFGGSCYSQVYLDQALVYRGGSDKYTFDINTLSPDQIEAIEYYAGPAQLPAKYQGLNANCGVIVIWRRRTPWRHEAFRFAV
jgi:hypothetical protein